MRLLLDEMHPHAIAEQLRLRGHDVVAVTEKTELRSLPDAALFGAAQEQGRAVATENVGDFIPLASEADQRGRVHHGRVLIDPTRYPRGTRRTLGRLVTALDRLLGAYSTDEPGSARHWL